MTTNVGLSIAGKTFFGSLCAGTFGLGVWQTQRLLEKLQLVEQRDKELSMKPTTDVTTTSFRRILASGVFQHEREFLVGPRGPPVGTLPNKPGSSAGGMSSSPQGYFVLTPFQLRSGEVILVNRGWVPRAIVMPDVRQQMKQRHPLSEQQKGSLLEWDRPLGTQHIVTVPSKPEQPRFLVAQHDLTTRPFKLYWFDSPAMQAVAGLPTDAPVRLLTMVREDDDNPSISLPLTTTASKLGEFKVTPAVHAGYAFTWFGLSAAGLLMTRKLILRR